MREWVGRAGDVGVMASIKDVDGDMMSETVAVEPTVEDLQRQMRTMMYMFNQHKSDYALDKLSWNAKLKDMDAKMTAREAELTTTKTDYVWDKSCWNAKLKNIETKMTSMEAKLTTTASLTEPLVGRV